MKGSSAIAIGVIALALLGLRSPQRKYPLKITYDGIKPYFYDYDWRVRAQRPRVTVLTIDDRVKTWGGIEEYKEFYYNDVWIRQDVKAWMPEMPIFRKDKSFYPYGKDSEGEGWVMDYYLFPNYGYGNSGWSKTWDFDNTQEFFANQAQQRVDKLITQDVVNPPPIEDLTNGNWRRTIIYPEIKDLEIKIETTNTYEKYAKKDQQLDSLVNFVPELIKAYISASVGTA